MRQRLIRTIVLGAIVLAATGCGQFGKVYEGETGPDSNEAAVAAGPKTAAISKKPFDDAAKKAAACKPIEEMDDLGREHSKDDQTYTENPPTSGTHSATGVEWGIYGTPQADEKLLHNMEYGHVVLAYKGLSPADKKRLLEYVKRDPFHIVVVPRTASPEKEGIWHLAWAKRMFCERPSAEGLQFFVDETRDQGPVLSSTEPSTGSSEK